MSNSTLLSSLLFAVCCWSSASLASAQDAPPPSSRVDTARPVKGLYVRAGLGFGGMANNVIRTREDAGGDNPEGTVTGMGLASEITVGLGVSDAWVLGLGFFSSQVFATDFTPIHGNDIPLDLQRPETMGTVAFLAEWHFAPDLGAYGQLGLGLSGLTTKTFQNGEADGSSLSLGPGLSFALGADFWRTQRWAVGVMARMTAAATFEDKGGEDYVHGIVTPSFLFTICYNE